MTHRHNEEEEEELNTEDPETPLLLLKDDLDTQARNLFINDREANKQYKFKDNSIATNKYYWWLFIPQNLWYQFHRVANLYFLLMSILQFIPGLSPTGRYTTIFPLSAILTITMIKELVEDIKRREADRKQNNRLTCRLQDGEFIQCKWKDLQVGDIVRIENKESFPADIVVLATSEPQGLCYVETSNLDGETNLKIKRARMETSHINDNETASDLHGTIQFEQPNNRLYNFDARIQIHNGPPISLDPDQLLLCGSTLRNTAWIIGVVIYTGHETKLMKNRNPTPRKVSKVEKKANRLVFIIMATQLAVCFCCVAGIVLWTIYHDNKIWYFNVAQFGKSMAGMAYMGFRNFWTFLILFGSLIPISLYASVELAKLLQGNLISKDLQMYHTESDTPAVVRSSSLNEDLGQINFIFSDKTGTLTCNKMDFMKFSVDGLAYGTGVTEIAKAAAKREGREIINDRPTDLPYNTECNFYDVRINEQNWARQNNADSIGKLLVLLAVCHTVIPEQNPKTGQIIYQASSPDENALVKAARYLGVEFIGRTTENVTIKVLGQEYIYEILAILEFNSDRKRQSVICRTHDGKLMLMTKGADTVLFPLLTRKVDEETVKHLENFANDGLRTLICAQKQLDEKIFQQWFKKFQEAKCSLVDREEKVAQVSAEIEHDLEYVGITAIEDKLQDGVPDTISELGKAGIKVWVLTGDKQETAINIGFACDLLNDSMGVLIVEGDNQSEIYSSLTKLAQIANEAQNAENPGEVGLVVNGDKLQSIFENEDLKRLFLRLGMTCKAVICSRVSPKQKADVVNLVKENLKAVTLAIGDGANDVSMIQAAHVGIGISGEEGLQAANAADYCIAQFRFLKRLLLVHGRWCYRRVSKLVLYCFYKQLVLSLTQFWFTIFNGFSGTTVHERWTLSIYNLALTAYPVMVLGILDRDIEANIVEQYPEIYHQGHKDLFFNARVFIGNVANGIFHSLICFFIPMVSLIGFSFQDGQMYDVLSMGVTIYTCVLFVVTIKIAMEMSGFTILHVLTFVYSICFWFGFLFVHGSIYYLIDIRKCRDFPCNEFYNFLQEWRILGTARYWAIVALTVTMALLRDFFYKCYLRVAHRHLYYDVMRKSHRRGRDYIMERYTPMDFLPKPIKQKKRRIHEIKEMFKRLKVNPHRGFAFSQTYHQTELLQDKLTKLKSE